MPGILDNPIGNAPVLQVNPMANTGGILGQGSIGAVSRPYKNVPDSLMGFGKGQPRGYNETNYPFEQWMHITLRNGTEFVDAMRGMNPAHAIERGYRNWDTENIRPITPTEAYQMDPGAFSPLDFKLPPMGGAAP